MAGTETLVEVGGHRLQTHQPRQGALPRDRHHEGRGARLLLARRRVPDPARPRSRRDPQALAQRRRHRPKPGQMFFEKQLPVARAELDQGPRDRAQRRPEDVSADQRPADAGLARADGGARAARSAVAVRAQRRAQEPGPHGARPRPRRGRRAARVRRGREAGARPAEGHGAGSDARHEREQGHPSVRGPRRLADERRDLGRRARARPRARGRSSRPRRQRHEEGAARRQGAASTGARTAASKTTIVPYSLRGRDRARRSPCRAPGASCSPPT